MSLNSMQQDPPMHHPGHVSMNQAKLSNHSYQQKGEGALQAPRPEAVHT